MKRIKNLSIPVISALSMVAVTTGVLSALGMVEYSIEKRTELQSLQETLDSQADQLAAGLTIPIWNIDPVQIGRIMESEMKNPDVVQVKVNAADETYIRRRGDTGEIASTEAKELRKDLLIETRDVFFADERIGTVEIALSPDRVMSQLRSAGIRYAMVILLVDLTLVIALYLLLWKIVLKPLRMVERYAVEVSSGRAGAKEVLRGAAFHFELEILRQSIEKMVRLLELQIAEVKESEERYRTLFAVEPDALFIVERENGQILDASEAATEIYGYSREELTKLTVFDLTSEPEKSRKVLDEIKPGDLVKVAGRAHRRKDGSTFPVDISTRAFSLRGHVVLVASVRDISERIRNENALRDAKDRAEAADRIKSEFLDIAAHELKTPLTPLTILLELARRDQKEGRPVSDELWERMFLQVSRLTGLVRDLLDVSRLEKGTFPVNPVKVDLAQLVSRCVQDFVVQSHKHKISFGTERSPIEVEADPIRIYEVVANLLDNAIKYTPDDSPIEAKVVPLPNDRVRVSVVDHGRGIPEDQRKALFSRFFRVNSDATIKHSGLGLGLYICRRILELHHGKIAVDSELGKGSTFYFELPRKAAK